MKDASGREIILKVGNEEEASASMLARVLNPILSGVRDAQANIPFFFSFSRASDS